MCCLYSATLHQADTFRLQCVCVLLAHQHQSGLTHRITITTVTHVRPRPLLSYPPVHSVGPKQQDHFMQPQRAKCVELCVRACVQYSMTCSTCFSFTFSRNRSNVMLRCSIRFQLQSHLVRHDDHDDHHDHHRHAALFSAILPPKYFIMK